MNAAITNKKIVIAVCTPRTVVSRSWLMSLIITFMFEPAKLQMNCASASGTSICRNAGDGRVTVTASIETGARRRRTRGVRVVEPMIEVQRGPDEREVGE